MQRSLWVVEQRDAISIVLGSDRAKPIAGQGQKPSNTIEGEGGFPTPQRRGLLAAPSPIVPATVPRIA